MQIHIYTFQQRNNNGQNYDRTKAMTTTNRKTTKAKASFYANLHKMHRTGNTVSQKRRRI